MSKNVEAQDPVRDLVDSLPKELLHFMTAWDDVSLNDGAWWAKLEEGAEEYNKLNHTDYDTNDAVHAYCHYMEQPQ